MFEPKRNLWAVSLLILLNPLAVRADETSEKIAVLRKKRENLGRFHLVATTVTRSGQGTRRAEIQLWEKIDGGKQMSRRIITTKVNPGTSDEVKSAATIMVKDGQNAWREVDMGDRKLVFSGESRTQHEYMDIESQLKKGVVRLRPGEKILDHECVLLEIREKEKEENIIASYWISERTGLVLKSIVESAGDTLTEFKVEELSLEQTFSDTVFSYEPPDGAQVIQNKGGKIEMP